MDSSLRFGATGDAGSQVLWEDGERTLCRRWRPIADGRQSAVLTVEPTAEHPTPASLDRLVHEYALKDQLDSTWAVRPLEVVHEGGRTLLLLEDPGGAPLGRLLGAPMGVGRFLRLAISIAAALGKAHQCGLVHKDLKPAHILVNSEQEKAWLTGFGIASRMPRERQAPEPPETIAGTLAYMAPEQTGRMNRSIDARSDLYALGVTLYQMLTGHLPFYGADPIEWVHCHIARKPVPPSERLEHVPASVSAIVMKLLAKTAEERYQTAGGLERDLRRCLHEWATQGDIEDFAPGQQDTPDRLLIPEKLYGRAREVETLLASFDRIVTNGAPELVLVSGYAGIGKSSVVNELHKVLVPPRGIFAAGKFDQYKRDIPYSTLAQAFQGLVRPLLGKSDAELAGWRDAFLQALGPNGRLIVDVVPELKLIIGEQPPVPELSPQDAQRRFQLVLRSFIGVLARPEHPLALFLDDLQWLDAATLDLLEDLLSSADLRHLMLIGAYRDNEVAAGHPLMRTLEAIRAAGGKVENIVLAPLAEEHLAQLIADALRCEPARAAPLAQLVHAKTGGNPFFANQFLSSLADTGLLAFDHDTACWHWDLARIHAKGYTDNVVDLMVAKLNRLPFETQTALQELACLGNTAETTTLAIVLGMSEAQVHETLRPAGRHEMVERLAGTCRFVHDRVQEAAYSLIEEERRGEMHLRIGRVLAQQTPAEKREEVIFEIVNHLNRAIPLIDSQAERERLAEFNLIAGRRAKASTAYASALKYLVTGSTLLGHTGWEQCRELVCALELNRAECEFLTGALAEADARLTALSARVATMAERASVASLRVELYLTIDRSGHAVAVGLDYLRHLGVEWSPHPTEAEARGEYERIWATLGNRPIETLVELPLMSDPASLVTCDVLVKLAVPALYTNANLFCLITCRLVNLSLEGGNSDGSCCAYEWLGGMIAGHRFGDYQTGFRFGRLGYDLVEQRGLERFKARIYVGFGNVVLPWTRHIRTGRELVRRAFEAGKQSGDLTFAAHCCSHLNTNLLAAGDPLADVQCEAERGLAFAQKMRFGLAIDRLGTQLSLIRTLRGLTPVFGRFDDTQFDERLIERRFAANPDLALAECWYWVRKLQARYLAGDYAAATEAAFNAQRLLWTSPSHFETAEYHFYSALSHAASCDVLAAERERHLNALVMHHRQLEIWAANCPDNFENRAALVAAEIARVDGRELDAERLYEQAIRSARDNGFVHHEALANELAARFYAARGFETISIAYLRNARYCYVCWGANAKVRQLDESQPRLKDELPAVGPTSTIGAPVEHLDLATVIKVSQAVSGEIILEKLIDMLMRTAMTQAGAERSLLLFQRGDALWIDAEATTRGDAVVVHLRGQPLDAAALPEPVLQYVLRTHESVIVGDASADAALAADRYILEHHARSILCIPLLNQAKLVGVLYLENNLAAHVFAPARVAVLKLLASQAAIALENSRLYQEAAERDRKIRRLVDANIIGIFVWRLEGGTPEFSDAAVYDVNDAFLRMMGYEREDFAPGRVRRSNLTPPEWRDRTAQANAELIATGTIQPYEKEYLRKDGSRVPVLVGISAFESGKEGVGFVLDLTERKQAEAKARESEQRYREVQAELAHANRATTMGQLTASIAHEIKQPIAATAANAAAAIHWLRAQPPNMTEAMQALDRIVSDSMRAGDIIGRIRDLIKKAPPRKDTVDVNEAVREVIELTLAEATKHGVSVKAVLADGLPSVSADRVQVQQVILNLIVNAIEAMSATSDGARDLLISTAAVLSNGVLIRVSDSGPGLPPDGSERVFEPFYTTKVGGLGMGLSICRSIVDAHGGRLSAKPNTPRGAVFEFSLSTHSPTLFGLDAE
ncbi:trifunctional serine/threonine-protein kinase/ATP-binding protein/sensor histidine kinase [Paraburkholderia rhizosphaerae]|uniref:histidine kinase n=1 Tax=Paraburkholderia rhizosphaerae TaxID=480658 RepID=A0A4R8LWB6_9BURK|nr:AAA family ATPase [Paraburkholderia rhizosphaerae]TDY52213.1 PAS domain S-box-containing protein [Paraburkholderia rhizosphaerae]